MGKVYTAAEVQRMLRAAMEASDDLATIGEREERVGELLAGHGREVETEEGQTLQDALDKIGPGAARKDDMSTAKAAAIKLDNPGTKRRKVLDAIVEAGPNGLTPEEACDKTGIEYRTVTPRVGELKNHGWIKALEGITRPGTHKVDQQILVPTDKALRAMGIDPAEFGRMTLV